MGGTKTPEILAYELESSVDIIRGLQFFFLFLCDCQVYLRTRDSWKSPHNVLCILHNLETFCTLITDVLEAWYPGWWHREELWNLLDVGTNKKFLCQLGVLPLEGMQGFLKEILHSSQQGCCNPDTGTPIYVSLTSANGRGALTRANIVLFHYFIFSFPNCNLMI